MKFFALLSALLFMVASAVAATQGSFVDKRDGRTYKTVQIGNQTWMAENLNYKTGDSYCYKNDESNCSKYGRLYQWNAAIKACPAGWHLPSKEDFEILFKAVGGTQDKESEGEEWNEAGKRLKSTSGWKEYHGKNDNGKETFGFSALPAGYRDYDGSYYAEGNYGYFWTSTECDSDDAYLIILIDGSEAAYLSNGGKNHHWRFKDYGRSVRCLKN